MTIIAALRTPSGIWLGGDSAVIDEDTLTRSADPKVFKLTAGAEVIGWALVLAAVVGYDAWAIAAHRVTLSSAARSRPRVSAALWLALGAHLFLRSRRRR